MATTGTKKAWKLQEFVAHAGGVNCLALGHKSGRVMVTGGDDKKVNMWAVGKPNCIMSLSGHTSPVEAVRFGNAEEIVVAGSLSGALKIWDLEAAKIVRTLTGHKSNIRSLDFHPYGDFVASGSADCNIKLWDIRRKGCIFTYKGHRNTVNCLKFSPDGRWISSGGEDGLLKLWDLTAGKLLVDLKHHTGPVNTIEFHPNEFLLATGSSDRTVKFWDLESFQLVSSTDGDSTGIRSILFHPEGTCLYAGGQDLLKVYGWEPSRCFDTVQVGWGRVFDLSSAQNQLIGASFSQTNVSTYVVDIQRVQPIGGEVAGPPVTIPHQSSPSPPKSASGRRSFIVDRPHTQSSRQQNIIAKEDPLESDSPTNEQEDDVTSGAEIKDTNNYEQVFQPRRKLTHSPSREPFQPPPDEGAPMPTPVMAPASQPVSRPAPASQPVSRLAPASQPVTRPPVSVANNSPKTSQSTAAKAAPSPRGGPAPKTSAPPKTAATATTTKTPANQPASPSVVPAHRNSPAGLDMDDFLPKQVSPVISSSEVPSNISESEAISSIIKGHDSIIKVMQSRHKNLQIVRALWTAGNIKTALDSAVGMHDLAVVVDVINVILQKPGLWSLDLVTLLLPHVQELMSSKYENYVNTGCGAAMLILRNFSSVIKANVTAPPSLGVDISREERYHKCKECYKVLMNIRSNLEQKCVLHGQLAGRQRELQMLMAQLD